MCRFLRVRLGKFPSPRLRSQRLSHASVSDRNRKLLLDRSTPSPIHEPVYSVAATREFLNPRAGPSLPGTVARILIRGRRRAVRCCQPADEYPEGDARCRARYRFQIRAAVAGARHLVLPALLTRTSRDE